MFLNKFLSLFVTICAIFGNNSEASDCLTTFNNISSFGGWLERDNGATQGLMIEFMPSGKYHIFEVSDSKYRGSLFGSNPNMNDFRNMTKSYFYSASINNYSNTVTVNDFSSFNTRYRLMLNSRKSSGTNVVLNCRNDEVFFGELHTVNIKSLAFNNAESISFKSIDNHSDVSLELDGCGTKIEVRTANIKCTTNSKLYAKKGHNNISLYK